MLLRRHHGISASQYLYELPWWETELLLTGLHPDGPVDEGS